MVIEVLGGVEVSENVIRSKAARSRHAQGWQNNTCPLINLQNLGIKNYTSLIGMSFHFSATDKQKPKPYKPPSDFKEYLKSMSKKLFTMKRLKGKFNPDRWLI